MTDSPKFEAGNTYRTVNGRTMRVKWADAESVSAEEVKPSLGNLPPYGAVNLIYHTNGIPQGDPKWSGFQLLPGAIEDDNHTGKAIADRQRADGRASVFTTHHVKRAADMLSWQDDGRTMMTVHARIPHGYTIKELWAYADGKPGFEAIAGRFEDEPTKAYRWPDDHEKRLAALESRFDSLVRIHDAHAGHILDAANKIENHGTRLMNLQDRITEAETRIEYRANGLARRMDSIDERVERAERDITTVGDRVTALESRSAWKFLASLMAEFHGKDVAARVEKLEQREELSGTGYNKEPSTGLSSEVTFPAPKPTIKGGWVNVYRDAGDGTVSIGALHATTEKAREHRSALIPLIACIRIPDFTEGEGL